MSAPPARPNASAPEEKPSVYHQSELKSDTTTAALLRMLRRPNSLTNLKALFDEYDSNNNGTIENEELKSLLVKIYRTPEFGGVDIAPYAQEMVEHLTKSVDTNEDGVLQFDEFIKAINIISGGEETD